MSDSKTFVIDGQSPYFLHPSYGPRAIIDVIKFNGENYALWQQAVTTALIAKNKLNFIDGTIEQPGSTSNLAEIRASSIVNSMIRSWILNVIDSKLQSSVAYEDTGKKM